MSSFSLYVLLYLRTLHIVWSLVRRRVTRRLTRFQTMHNVLKNSKTLQNGCGAVAVKFSIYLCSVLYTAASDQLPPPWGGIWTETSLFDLPWFTLTLMAIRERRSLWPNYNLCLNYFFYVHAPINFELDWIVMYGIFTAVLLNRVIQA